ncbi:hypothetical protein B0T12DRAFT_410098 [Alternaria alternata]|nr:hypothetical protein B0T12DRAFT_410098 [Alternaria alternata]
MALDPASVWSWLKELGSGDLELQYVSISLRSSTGCSSLLTKLWGHGVSLVVFFPCSLMTIP